MEMMVALSLVMIGAIFALQTLFDADSRILISRTALKDRLHDDSLASHIDSAFITDTLIISDNTGVLDNDNISSLIDQTALQIAPIISQRSRYLDNRPACRLTSSAQTSPPAISFATDCITTDDNRTLATLISELWDKGVPLLFGLIHGTGICQSRSAPSETGAGLTAQLELLSSDCLISADNQTAPEGSEILFPRYMVFDAEHPGLIYHGLLEPASARHDGASLSLPEELFIRSGRRTQINDIQISSLSEDTELSLTLATDEAGARLSVDEPAGATLTDNNSSEIVISGSTEQILSALTSLFYLSPQSYFGTDRLSGEIRIGPQLLDDDTALIIEPNCGEQTQGTAVRFDLGHMDNSTFILIDYLTAISLVSDHVPQRYYGYCRHSHSNTNPRHRYDLDNGSRNLISDPFTCESVQDPDPELDRFFTQASTAIEFDEEDRLTVFVYEEEDRYDEDRFSLFFLFGDAGNDCATDPDEGGDIAGRCEVDVSLSNLESGRDLEDITDIFTFADDPGEYAGDDGTAVISDTGVIEMTPVWRGAHDGLFVPLRLPAADNCSENNLPALSDYSQDPDGDNISDPSLTLNSTDTLHDWLVRGLSEDGESVEMRSFSFDVNSSDERSTIRLRVSEARRCPS